MTHRPPPSTAPPPSASSSTSSPLLNAPPIRMRHPLPAPPLPFASSSSSTASISRSRSGKPTQPLPPPPPSRASARSPRYSYSTMTASASPSTSPYYSSSHPSPAPSSTSTASASSAGSSLRTPPDLLVNGASVGHKGERLAVNSWNGLLVQPRQPRHLGKEEIGRRKRLLADLPAWGGGWELPSPPASPKLAHGEEMERDSRKRRRASSVEREREREVEHKTASSKPLPPKGAKEGSATPTALSSLASAYRSAARELKHNADARASSLSASRPSYLAARPTEVSALEQLDAVLLFAHAFWLDDLAASTTTTTSSSSSVSGGGCIAKNWISLFGLLRYATNAHSDLGNDVLLGICRLIEAAVLRKLYLHDTALLRRSLHSSSPPTAVEVGMMLERQSADLERSDRLAAHARTALALPQLAVYPELRAAAIESGVPGTEAAARGLEPRGWPECARFAWPLDAMTPIPHLVCFGRSAVAEHARVRGVNGFVLRQVATS